MSQNNNTRVGVVVVVVLKKYQHYHRRSEGDQLEFLEASRDLCARAGIIDQFSPASREVLVFVEIFERCSRRIRKKFVTTHIRQKQPHPCHGKVFLHAVDHRSDHGSVTTCDLQKRFRCFWVESFANGIFELIKLLFERFITHGSSWNSGWVKLLLFYNKLYIKARIVYGD